MGECGVKTDDRGTVYAGGSLSMVQMSTIGKTWVGGAGGLTRIVAAWRPQDSVSKAEGSLGWGGRCGELAVLV